jgi:outer membrane receptor protein involved in Fe transport
MFGSRQRMFLEGSIYGEGRLNGTPLQTNDVTIRQVSLGEDYDHPTAGLFTLRLFGGTESYHQTFSSIAADRNSESLTNNQHVPVQQMGFIAQWSQKMTSNFTMLAGLDGSDVEGVSQEATFSQRVPTALLSNGGRQHTLGVFLEGSVQLSRRWSLTASGREDLWSNFDASSVRTPVAANLLAQTFFAPRGQNSFNPRMSLSYRASDHVVLYASGYRSFRAPTLNELYRSFRVGNVQTQANANLRAEHFAGAEGGGRATMFDNRLAIHASLFWGYVTDSVANVTLSVTPSLITRQRQNLGELRSRGVEAGAEFKVNRAVWVSASYQFLDATVVGFSVDPSLVGNMIPLVPRHEFTFETTWSAPQRLNVAVQGRTASNEFDDDQNLLPLGSYLTLSATVSRSLRKGFTVFAAGENLTNDEYAIARTPVVNLASPALVRVGLRWESGEIRK